MELPSAILFCCTMNSIRSPMAAGIMRHFHGRRVYVDSCGVRPEGNEDGFMIQVMDEIGIDLTGHRQKSFDQLEDDNFDLVVSLSPEAQHKAVDMTAYLDCDVEFWNTYDPSLATGSRDQRLDEYRMVRDQLIMKIKQRFPLHGMVDT